MGRKKASSRPSNSNSNNLGDYQPMVDDDSDSLLATNNPPASTIPSSSQQQPIFVINGDDNQSVPTMNNNFDQSPLIHESSSNNNNGEKEFKVLTFEEVVAQIGFGWYQILLMNVCGAGWLFDGIELTMISFIVPQLTDEWSLSPVQAGSLGSAVFLGMMFGAWLGGLYFQKLILVERGWKNSVLKIQFKHISICKHVGIISDKIGRKVSEMIILHDYLFLRFVTDTSSFSSYSVEAFSSQQHLDLLLHFQMDM